MSVEYPPYALCYARCFILFCHNLSGYLGGDKLSVTGSQMSASARLI